MSLELVEVFREFHAPNGAGVKEVHDHMPVLGVDRFRYLPMKRALLERHGLATHWSCTHDGHWSTVRYCAVASPKKPKQCLDPTPALWAARGTHPPIEDCCYEPITAAALQAKRARLVQDACEAGEKEPTITQMDVWALVVRAGIRNTADNRKAHLQLADYAKDHCGEAMVHYLFRHRQQLPAMIDDIWEWEEVKTVVAQAGRSRLETLVEASNTPCICAGQWAAHAVSSVQFNGINIGELCYDVLDALIRGRSETTPVVVLAGSSGGEGKSFFLKPLFSIFKGVGAVFGKAVKGNYPLMNLPFCRVAFLDEYRFDRDIVPWSDLFLWFDGSSVPISRPQNIKGVVGHEDYTGSAPIFVTTKLADMEWLESSGEIDASTGKPWDSDASMLLRRLKVYRFTQRVPKPRRTIPYCGRCFSRLIKEQADAWAAAHGVRLAGA